MTKPRLNQNNQPIKGVNLGGWLVLERWMTPSVFAGGEAANEYELSHSEAGRRAIERHRKNFITETDIAWLARAQVEAVRLPIGYWHIIPAPPYVPGDGEIGWLLDTAKKYRIKVLLCLHAAPGAQNANDHSGSGQPGKTSWYRFKNLRQTYQILLKLARQYGAHDALWGIELLNEPLANGRAERWMLLQWSRVVAGRLKKHLPRRVKLVFSDCYNPVWWHKKLRRATLDIHHYQCFSLVDVDAKTYEHHRVVLQNARTEYEGYANNRPVIIGEWSATLPPIIISDDNAKDFCQNQLEMMQFAEAWFFWSYKTEHTGSWNFKDCYKKGYFKGFL